MLLEGRFSWGPKSRPHPLFMMLITFGSMFPVHLTPLLKYYVLPKLNPVPGCNSIEGKNCASSLWRNVEALRNMEWKIPAETGVKVIRSSVTCVSLIRCFIFFFGVRRPWRLADLGFPHTDFVPLCLILHRAHRCVQVSALR